MRRFREGGNLTVSGYDGNERSATKLLVGNMSPDQFENFKKDFVTFLLDLSDEFKKFSGRPIWEEDEETKLINELMAGHFYSGSTRPMFQKSHDIYTKYKPKVGDFDVQVPSEIKEDFIEFIVNEMPGMKLGNVRVYGTKRGEVDQSHALVQFLDYPDLGADYAQIDFEYTEFINNKPSEFSTFGHYSSWEDIEHNVKGAFQKILLKAICHAADLRDITIIGKRGKALVAPNRKLLKNMLSFSVDKGIRVKYKPALDEEGNQIYVDGKEAWLQVPTKESTYLRNIKDIFERIFGEAPSSDSDIKALYSYIRTIKLFKKYYTKEQINRILMEFVDLLWGEDAQKMSAFDKDEDRTWKEAAFNEFIKENPISESMKKEISEIREEFYSNYVNRERAEDEG